MSNSVPRYKVSTTASREQAEVLAEFLEANPQFNLQTKIEGAQRSCKLTIYSSSIPGPVLFRRALLDAMIQAYWQVPHHVEVISIKDIKPFTPSSIMP